VVAGSLLRTEKKTYTLTNQTDNRARVFIERPIRQGWELKTEPNAKIERTPQTYRLRVELQGKQTATLPVVERQALMDTFALSNFTSENLQILVARRYIDDATRAQLAQLIELKSRIAALDANAARSNRKQTRLPQIRIACAKT
jgi:hypothetical protein